MTTFARHVVRLASLGAVTVLCASALRAQAGPPLAKQDTQPALRKPQPGSPPPSTVAPSRGRRRATAADSVPVTPMKRVSAPPDSVRPAPAAAAPLDSARMPRTQPMVRPGARQDAAAAPSASTASDQPPAGAKARCKDGTFVMAPVDDATCRTNGGIAVRFPDASVAPRRP